MNRPRVYERCAGTPSQFWTFCHGAFLARRQRVLQKATEVLGSRDIAENWLFHPAIGLG